MDFIINSIMEYFKNLCISGITSNLSAMFADVNTKVGTIGAEVGQTPQTWNAGIYNMIQNLSNVVILPIAGIIITYVLVYELIQVVNDKNHGNVIDFWGFFKYFFKSWVAVWILSNTFNFVMGIFELAQFAVAQASGSIGGSTNIDATVVIADMTVRMNSMELSELLQLYVETGIVSLCMKILSVCITVILYGRIIEIYCYCSIAPIPFATLANREWGSIGTNYIKGLFALGFQGFFIMICVGIYAVLVGGMTVSADVHMALFSIMAYTVVLCVSLFHTGSVSKAIFNSH